MYVVTYETSSKWTLFNMRFTPMFITAVCAWFTVLLQPQVFRAYSFNSCNIHFSFRLTRLLSWQKLTWIFYHFRDTLGLIASCALLCSYHTLTSSVLYYWTDALQHGICELGLVSILEKIAGNRTLLRLKISLIAFKNIIVSYLSNKAELIWSCAVALLKDLHTTLYLL